MDSNRLAFDELGLERLDREPVQSRSAILKDWVSPSHFLEEVPDLGCLRLDMLLG